MDAKMNAYDVACWGRGHELLWSATWEAISPAHAIAQATLPPAERFAWMDQAPRDEDGYLIVPHPLCPSISVSADQISE